MTHAAPRAGRRLGVDVGGTDTKWVVLDGDTVTGAGTVATPPGPGETMTLVASLADPSVEGIGIALPGHVDRETGTALFVPNPPGDWDGYPAGPRLSALTGRPVAVVNDARAFAQAELLLGAARGLPDVLFAVLGTGVGGAVALRGAVLVGPRDNLGEVGHVTVDPSGPPCCCGNRGCAETFAGGPGIVRAFGSGPAAAVAAAARAGDERAAGVLARAGWALGVALGDAAALFGVGAAVVGGGVSGALDLMRPALERELGRRRPLIGDVAVLPAVLGPRAGAIGAALCGGMSG
ncbi:ROK family protein [Nonomuraea sp. SMC257]|uniref:ROK family protein n=1 Tax=Nonomuraea montanisoli TaxID=2741721 RepID=A0A7Y6M305_9ACTN|nr:ROK family protein [Nonomuraea montanisoli]NUW31729.1 ROK family protein [Nonomuraea montanisoli]